MPSRSTDSLRGAGTSSSPPARTRGRCPVSRSTGAGCITSEHALAARHVPSPGHRARRRRDRRRVRQRVALVRRRRHDHRGAAQSGADRGRGLARKALERAFRRARHRLRPARASKASSADTGVRVTAGGRETLEARPAARRGRPRPGYRGARLRGRRASRWSAGSCSPTSGCAPTSPASGRSATSCPGSQLAHRGFQQGIFVAEEIAGLEPPTYRRSRNTAGDLLRAGGRVRRAHRDAGREEYGADDVESFSYDLSRQRQEPDPRRPRASSSSYAARTVRSSASTSSGHASAS